MEVFLNFKLKKQGQKIVGSDRIIRIVPRTNKQTKILWLLDKISISDKNKRSLQRIPLSNALKIFFLAPKSSDKTAKINRFR